jgi:hypothetical protein
MPRHPQLPPSLLFLPSKSPAKYRVGALACSFKEQPEAAVLNFSTSRVANFVHDRLAIASESGEAWKVVKAELLT